VLLKVSVCRELTTAFIESAMKHIAGMYTLMSTQSTQQNVQRTQHTSAWNMLMVGIALST